MVKFKWPVDKIHLQRVILLSIIGLISCGIFKGHLKYEQEVTIFFIFQSKQIYHSLIETVRIPRTSYRSTSVDE